MMKPNYFDYFQYYYSLLLLYVLFRIEANLLLDHDFFSYCMVFIMKILKVLY
jgi:hypothetical protein